MKIKKLDEEITYKKITITHTFEINDKEVRVYVHDSYSNYGDYDYDTEIDDNDDKVLDEIEREALDDEMSEILKLKVGEEYQANVIV